MNPLPAALLLTVAAVLGVWLGVLYLRRVRRPALIGVHLLLGAASLQVTLMMLRGMPNGDSAPATAIGLGAAGCLAAAMFSGLLAPLVGRGSRRAANLAVATHASAGLGGFLLFMAWIVRS